MINILSDDFTTKLGVIQTWLETASNENILQQHENKCVTSGHIVYLQLFDLKQIWSPDTIGYESAKVWRWFIEKLNDQTEQLLIYCKLINPLSGTEYDSDSGEHLDAIEIKNQTYHLHLGTEDGERMHSRAEAFDWMPERFKEDLSWHDSFTEYIDYGFKTTVPKLKGGEKIYFHYIVATNSIKQSEDYPKERDISTWLTVDKN